VSTDSRSSVRKCLHEEVRARSLSPPPRKSGPKGRKRTRGAMGGNEKDQKTSAMIMTNHKTPKMLFYITKEAMRLNGPITNLLTTHIHLYPFYLNRKIDYSEICGYPTM